MKLPKLSFWQIWNINIGFLGVQYSFGLQQNAIVPVWAFLGVNPEDVPYLYIAGPVTGLIVQPIVGAMSDRTWSPRWGRRKPYFLIGAIAASLGLLIMPFSQVLWLAVVLLWVLDIANNTTMEPYRAFVADTLNDEQKPLGYLMQSFFTGLGITLASSSLWFFKQIISGSTDWNIPYWVFASFFVGGFISIGSILWSVLSTKETPPTPEQIQHIQAQKKSLFAPIIDIFNAIKVMPLVLRQLAVVYLFQWYAMLTYWEYFSFSVAKSIWGVSDHFSTSPEYQEAAPWAGLMNGFYNLITLACAFFLVRFAKKYGAKMTHVYCLLLGGIALISIPQIYDPYTLMIPMVGLGIAWASMMGVPYIFIVPSLPRERYGVYMGIVNMMIVVPMIIQTLTFSYIYENYLDKNPSSAIFLGGVFLCIAAVLTLTIKLKPTTVS